MSLLPSMAATPYTDNGMPGMKMPMASTKDTAKAAKAGRQFEAMFMSQMITHMFEGIKADGIFGGGNGEEMFRSLLVDEYGKMVANKGNGIGIGAAVQKMLLSHQEVQ
ncbi:Flagellar protein FlgJ peptidoglycan hydrolase [Paramagnetospirillum magnetotacticum MS-1]|uniref:Flagellar protein FlgJ peptidoglycan hydrolase n=1 Tax=Paramagnetospirillum magnetotacticum MS-1 TaxID=272627 RepID=A0A0C2UWM5_PARME|nr:rod-binding protein [Paramagnetospirillum magnetotacticum]KIL97211.1 Flagellar protein FlgJ peptidoglycan hydrolase [Paramagnetospirillum magnetotacticum MS-1]